MLYYFQKMNLMNEYLFPSMDLLSPTSAFHFPIPAGDGQSLQRHRSTSTPNVHMVSTVGPAGASIIEVR